MEHAADIAYVPRRVTDRRAASIADEFHDSDAAAQPQTSREARISRQTASLAGDDEERQAEAQDALAEALVAAQARAAEAEAVARGAAARAIALAERLAEETRLRRAAPRPPATHNTQTRAGPRGQH